MCLIWGSTFVVLKMGLKGTPPILGVTLRHLLASVLLFPIVIPKRSPIPIDRLAVSQYLTLGLLNFFLSYALTYSGTRFIDSHISALLWGSVPITTALVVHLTRPANG